MLIRRKQVTVLGEANDADAETVQKDFVVMPEESYSIEANLMTHGAVPRAEPFAEPVQSFVQMLMQNIVQ